MKLLLQRRVPLIGQLLRASTGISVQAMGDLHETASQVRGESNDSALQVVGAPFRGSFSSFEALCPPVMGGSESQKRKSLFGDIPANSFLLIYEFIGAQLHEIKLLLKCQML